MKQDHGIHPAGKGSQPRPVNTKRYYENLDAILRRSRENRAREAAQQDISRAMLDRSRGGQP